MPRKLSFGLLAVVVAGLLVFGAVRALQLVTAEHNGWDLFSPVGVTTDPLVVEPSNLLSPDERGQIEKVVNEARTYGVPWSIHVVRPDADAGEFDVQELADQRYASRPVETTEDADDGLLMLVAVPADDHTATEVAFATGGNFYPRGGITPERLREIVDVQMTRALEENRLGDAVIEGATWVEWTHLFRQTPEPAPTNLERGMRNLLEPFAAISLAGLAALMAAGAVAVVVITRRGTGRAIDQAAIDPVRAAAVERGRVDAPVVAGATLDAIERGVLTLAPDGTVGRGALTPVSERDEAIVTALGDRRVPLRGLVHGLQRDGHLRRLIEDTLAASGAFHPRSPVLTAWLRWPAVGGLLLGVLGTVLAVLGSARYALAAALALTVISLVVALWNERRSWSTGAGERAIAAWRDQHLNPVDSQRTLYEAIVSLEAITATRDRSAPVAPAVLAALPDPH